MLLQHILLQRRDEEGEEERKQVGKRKKIKRLEFTAVKDKFHEGHVLSFLLLLCMTASNSPPLV